jgi:transcriptional regulator with XRE-family HTH domain
MQKSVHSQEQEILQTYLRELRSAAGLLQEDLGKILERPQTYVSRYEIGEKMLDVPELRQICHALGTTLPAFIAEYERRLKEAGL